MQRRSFLNLLLLTLSACARAVVSKRPVVPATSATLTPVTRLVAAAAENGNCALKPMVAPTMPAKLPGPDELEETTGLHVTGHAQVIDLAGYRLKISGKVKHPLSLRYDELRCMAKVTARPLLHCPGVFDDTSTWSGVPLKDVLERAGMHAGAVQLLLKGADQDQYAISVADALNPDSYLAYEWEGQPLPILHGFPLRAIFPGKPGARWVKWLVELIVE